MWRQIPWVANALTLQGGLELLAGFALLLGATDSEATTSSSPYEQWVLRVGPVVLVICGSLKAFAANRNRRFRGRSLGVAALWSSIPTAAIWPCSPSALALLLYGGIVYRDRMSRCAFALGESGKSPQDISTALLQESETPT